MEIIYASKLCFGARIPNLWKFSRGAAGKSKVELKQILPASHFLYSHEADFKDISPRAIRQFLRRIVRLPITVPPFALTFDNQKSFLQALSACFGLDYGKDEERQTGVLELIPHLVTNPELLNEVIGILPRYKAWTASGAHRFMPLALAGVNMFRGKNIFDGEAIRELQTADPSFRYLSEMHPFYSNYFNVPHEYIPTYLPSLVLAPPPDSGVYKWLDIGSAPKTGGAPTLKALKSAFENCLRGTRFEFYGTDIAMPIFEITKQGEIKRSQFFNQRTGWIKPKTMVDGITYLDAATNPLYDVMGDEFLKGEPMDFISICMTLHHLKKRGEAFVRLPFSSLNIVDSSGKILRDEIMLTTTLSHQRVVDRLLKRLRIGGILFLDPHATMPVKRFDWDNQNENINDLFYVLKRISENTYVFYGDTPIPFRPDGDEFIFSRNRNFIDGYDGPADADRHPGIRKLYPGRNSIFYKQVLALFDCADMLAFRYQGWKTSIWGSLAKAAKAITARRSLLEIFQIYLDNVPNEDLLKRRILEEAGKLF